MRKLVPFYFFWNKLPGQQQLWGGAQAVSNPASHNKSTRDIALGLQALIPMFGAGLVVLASLVYAASQNHVETTILDNTVFLVLVFCMGCSVWYHILARKLWQTHRYTSSARTL